MRAISLSREPDAEAVVRAAAEAVEQFRRENGSLADAVLVMTVRACVDREKDNGTTPQRKA